MLNAAGRQAFGFVSTGRPNRGALVLKEKAAVRRLQQAQGHLQSLKAPKQANERDARANRRASGVVKAEGSRVAYPRESSSTDESSYVYPSTMRFSFQQSLKASCNQP